MNKLPLINKLSLWLLLAASLTLAGCARISHHTTFPENKPIALGPNLGPGRNYVLLRPFTEKERQVYLFFHWVPLNLANGLEGAEKHLKDGDGIVNLRIRTYYGPVDLFFTLITAGVITSYTIDAHGDIIKLADVPPKL